MTVLIAVVVAVLAAGVVGLLWRRGEGGLRRGSGERIDPAEVLLPAGAFGPNGTLLLFTSVQDDRGPALRRVLDELAEGRPGTRVAAVDLTAHGDLAGRYAVTRTPTTFVLDGDARLRGRVKGVASRETLLTALATIGPAASRG